jgi:single-stranded DNA-binding protein
MIDGLVSGKLYGTATIRTGQSGKSFVTCKVRAAVDAGESLFVNVISFSTTAGNVLLKLADGDSVALTGTLTPKAWTDKHGDAKPGLDMVVHAVLTAYHVKRKRAAMRGDETVGEHDDGCAAMNGASRARQTHGGVPMDDMNDDL